MQSTSERIRSALPAIDYGFDAVVIVECAVVFFGIIAAVGAQIFGALDQFWIGLLEFLQQWQQMLLVALRGPGHLEGQRQFVRRVDDKVHFITKPLNYLF